MASLSKSNPSVEQQRELDREVRDMVSALSSRLTNLQHLQKKGHSNGQLVDGEGDDGVSFITLAGNNIGASMRGDTDEKSTNDVENEALTTYINSNFQTINSSIMLGGNFTESDSGVHLNISDETKDEEGRNDREGSNQKPSGY